MTTKHCLAYFLQRPGGVAKKWRWASRAWVWRRQRLCRDYPRNLPAECLNTVSMIAFKCCSDWEFLHPPSFQQSCFFWDEFILQHDNFVECSRKGCKTQACIQKGWFVLLQLPQENYEVIKECWARGCGCEQAANPKMKETWLNFRSNNACTWFTLLVVHQDAPMIFLHFWKVGMLLLFHNQLYKTNKIEIGDEVGLYYTETGCESTRMMHSIYHINDFEAILLSMLAICVFGIGRDGVKLIWEKLFGSKKEKEKKDKKEKKAGGHHWDRARWFGYIR